MDTSEERAGISRLESTVDRVSTWMASNQLKMNPDKTEVAIFVSNRLNQKVSATSIKVAGETVNISSVLKYLGVWFDSHLNMEKHIAAKCKSASHNIRNIASI